MASPGEDNRDVLLSISSTLEMSDKVFLKKEATEELLQRLESSKNLLVQLPRNAWSPMNFLNPTLQSSNSSPIKATGKDREIYKEKGNLVGMKKALVFYRGRASRLGENQLDDAPAQVCFYDLPRAARAYDKAALTFSINDGVEDMHKVQDLEEEIAELKLFVEKLEETFEYLVLQNLKQVQQIRGCEAIVIKNEYELDLLMRYCMAYSEFGNEAVPNKMIEIDTDLSEEEFNNIIYEVQKRGWQWNLYLRRN